MNYLKQLQQAHRIEVAGEAAFATAARRTSDPDRKRKWQTLAQLENHMKEQLATAIAREGAAVHETGVAARLGQALGAMAAALPWGLALRALGAITGAGVRFWQRLEREHPGHNDALLTELTAHERAQSEFVKRELHGQPARSLEPVVALLERST